MFEIRNLLVAIGQFLLELGSLFFQAIRFPFFLGQFPVELFGFFPESVYLSTESFEKSGESARFPMWRLSWSRVPLYSSGEIHLGSEPATDTACRASVFGTWVASASRQRKSFRIGYPRTCLTGRLGLLV